MLKKTCSQTIVSIFCDIDQNEVFEINKLTILWGDWCRDHYGTPTAACTIGGNIEKWSIFDFHRGQIEAEEKVLTHCEIRVQIRKRNDLSYQKYVFYLNLKSSFCFL